MPEYIPTDEELNELYAWACNEENGGVSRYSGMTYEEGIKAVIDLLQGNVELSDIVEG